MNINTLEEELALDSVLSDDLAWIELAELARARRKLRQANNWRMYLLPRDFWGFECRWGASIPDLLSQAVAQVQEVRMGYGSAGCLTSKEEAQLNKCQTLNCR